MNLKFLTQSQLMFNKIQSLKQRIEAHEYNYKFTLMLKKDQLKYDKMLNNQVHWQNSEPCGSIYKVFQAAVDFVIVYEDMIRKHQVSNTITKTLNDTKFSMKEAAGSKTARYKSKDKSPALINLYSQTKETGVVKRNERVEPTITGSTNVTRDGSCKETHDSRQRRLNSSSTVAVIKP